MIIPGVPLSKMVDENGNVTNEWRIYFEQLSNQLRTNTICTYEEMTVGQMAAIPTGQINGRFIYTTDVSDLYFGADDSFLLIDTL